MTTMKTIRSRSLIAIIGMLLCWFVPSSIWASVLIDGIYYELDTSTMTAEVVEHPNEYDGDIDIPETVSFEGNNYSVTSIGEKAFALCSFLFTVSIPSSVVTIKDNAFSNSDRLCNLDFSYGLITIGDNAFQGSGKLLNVELPSSVKTIGSKAFDYCFGLESITIPSSVSSIGDRAFTACFNLTSITVDADNTTYDSREGCNAIIETSTNKLIAGCRNTVIPSSVTGIGDDAFDSCHGMSSITIPNSVTSIDKGAFSNCYKLKSIIVENVTPFEINDLSFDGVNKSSCTLFVPVGSKSAYESANYWNEFKYICELDFDKYINGILYRLNSDNRTAQVVGDGMEEHSIYTGDIDIPLDVTYHGVSYVVSGIDAYAFSGCIYVTSVTMPNTVTSIGMYAFFGCKGISSLVIPNSVTSIGFKAFYHCTGLTSLKTSANLTDIGRYAFADCPGLTTVTIPANVTSIGDNAFDGCTGLTTIFVANTNPPLPINQSTFNNVNKSTCTLSVIAGSKSAYKKAEGWKDFTNIVEHQIKKIPPIVPPLRR